MRARGGGIRAHGVASLVDEEAIVPVTAVGGLGAVAAAVGAVAAGDMLLSSQVLWQRLSERHSSAMWQHMLNGSPAFQGRYWGFEGLRRSAVGGHRFSSSCMVGTNTDA